MSYNRNLNYRNFRRRSTFQNRPPAYLPAPPLPPPFLILPEQQFAPERTDNDIVKQFENRKTNYQPVKTKPSISISKVRDELRNLEVTLNEVKKKQEMLLKNINELTDEEWNTNLNQIAENKAVVSEILSNVNNLNTEVLRKLLAKRSAKRARQKRQRFEKKKAKEEWLKQKKEKSRKIEDYLQKFQDDIKKTKQEEEAKLERDAVLRETIRKKQDAKKYIVKLDALVKLRKARQNTAKGRGENVSEKESEVFENNIEKLKSMWKQRLTLYEKEETELRTTLQQDPEDLNTNETEREVTDSLDKWKETLFGGMLPQVDFAGNVGRFVAVRSQWDKYLNSEGSSLPIGWVPPTAKM